MEEEFIFQRDNDPKYIVKKGMKFFSNSDIKLLEWSVQSLDLNTIENLWCVNKIRVHDFVI